jgi:hypothetical protein
MAQWSLSPKCRIRLTPGATRCWLNVHQDEASRKSRLHMEPGHMEPGHMEPGHMEPGHMEPGHMEPGHMEPGHTSR